MKDDMVEVGKVYNGPVKYCSSCGRWMWTEHFYKGHRVCTDCDEKRSYRSRKTELVGSIIDLCELSLDKSEQGSATQRAFRHIREHALDLFPTDRRHKYSSVKSIEGKLT